MGEFLVPSDKHPDLRVVRADVVVDHIIGDGASPAQVFVHEVEDHVRIEQGRLSDALRGKAVIVVPGPHDPDELIRRMMELRLGGIVVQHVPNLRFRETDHPLEVGLRGIVGPDVEAGGQVVHRDGAHPRDVHPADGRGGTGFDRIIERTECSVPMRLRLVVVHPRRVRENRIREMVVLVDEHVYLPAGAMHVPDETRQHRGRVRGHQDILLRPGKKQVFVSVAK